jgi:hypothetical protein
VSGHWPDWTQKAYSSEPCVTRATNKAVPFYTCCPQSVAQAPLAAAQCGTDTTSGTSVAQTAFAALQYGTDTTSGTEVWLRHD